MIKIYQKTQQELENEQKLYNFGAAVAKGMAREACPTYLMKKDGTKVDTYNLTEEQILGIVQNDLIDYVSPQGTYKTTGKIHLDSFVLAEKLNGHYHPSAQGILQFAKMEQQFGGIVRDLMGSFGALKGYEKARVIAQYQKECSGDFLQPNSNEILDVLQQMVVNEQAKKNASPIKR